MENFDEVKAGQSVYTKQVLAIYDIWVLGISNRLIWKCPSSHILELYNKHISNNHLDIGIGTGFFLAHCNFPTSNPRLALIDLNPNTLELCSRRLKQYQPQTYQRNVLEPIKIEAEKFDSVGLNYLLHCLPGTMLSKGIVFENIKPVLNSGGVVFGSTILSKGVETGFMARYLMDIYNQKGIFSNREDSLENLQKILKQNFDESSIKTIGSVALFWGRLS